MRYCRRLLLLTLALITPLAPTLDATFFGIHDHVAQPETAAATEVVDPSEQNGSPIAHHCDGSVSPALGVWHPTVSAPLLAAALLPTDSIVPARYTPVVPTTPPRA